MRLAAVSVGGVVGTAMASAVPLVSALLAVKSAINAWRAIRDPQVDARHTGLAVAHLAADTVRIFVPAVGVLANVALVGGNALFEAGRARYDMLRDGMPAEVEAFRAGMSVDELDRRRR
jgi:hypothetical protein